MTDKPTRSLVGIIHRQRIQILPEYPASAAFSATPEAMLLPRAIALQHAQTMRDAAVALIECAHREIPACIGGLHANCDCATDLDLGFMVLKDVIAITAVTCHNACEDGAVIVEVDGRVVINHIDVEYSKAVYR